MDIGLAFMIGTIIRLIIPVSLIIVLGTLIQRRNLTAG